MFLTIDIGNTRAKVGIFDENRNLIDHLVIKTLSPFRLSKLINNYHITHSIVCNSGVVEQEIIDLLSSETKFEWLSDKSSLPLKLQYKTPNTLGRDRIAAAIGAWRFVGSKNPCLIINMGTCITMDIVCDGVFLGGNISPGIAMRLKAMHKFTARLPQVNIVLPDNDLGDSTVSALQNGGIKGAFREVDTFIHEMSTKYDDLKVLLAGGDANLFGNYTKNVIFVRPNIVLEGLLEILKYNAEN
jgi:type III pantothenate kinase